MRYPVSKPSVGEEEMNAAARVIDSGWLTQGREVERFEERLAEFLKVRHVVACSSGTAALHLALRAAGIGPGDEVLIPDLTYVATINAVLYCGAKPVLVDVRREDWNMDLTDAARYVTKKTRAVLAVHLYGVPCDRNQLLGFCETHGLTLIEDAAEALGATFDDGRACGSAGELGTFSFYANKIITTGEGGAVVTHDAGVARRLRLLRGQGQDPNRRFWHLEMGYNYRLTELQAALGLAQIARLEKFLAKRNAVCTSYRETLGAHLSLQEQNPYTVAAPWLFTGMLPQRNGRAAVMGYLAGQGIETRPTFSPLHRLPYIANGKDSDGCYPVACQVGDRGISLPTYAALWPSDAREISHALLCAMKEVAA